MGGLEIRCVSGADEKMNPQKARTALITVLRLRVRFSIIVKVWSGGILQSYGGRFHS
jgi:hypothetical protein